MLKILKSPIPGIVSLKIIFLIGYSTGKSSYPNAYASAASGQIAHNAMCRSAIGLATCERLQNSCHQAIFPIQCQVKNLIFWFGSLRWRYWKTMTATLRIVENTGHHSDRRRVVGCGRTCQPAGGRRPVGVSIGCGDRFIFYRPGNRPGFCRRERRLHDRRIGRQPVLRLRLLPDGVAM